MTLLLFLFKDGFRGQSIGKKLMGIVVLNEATRQPIGFGKSFSRNSVLLCTWIPMVGPVLALIAVVTIAFQVAKGYRFGDRFARTRAVWKTYLNHPVFGGTEVMCERCGYELRGNVSGICPECGTPVSDHNAVLINRASPDSTAAIPVVPL